MKLHSKILLFVHFINLAYGREIVLISSNNKDIENKMVIKVLSETFSFPENTIKVVTSDECNHKTNSVLHFCIDDEGTISLVEFDDFVLRNNMSDFLKLRRSLQWVHKKKAILLRMAYYLTI